MDGKNASDQAALEAGLQVGALDRSREAGVVAMPQL